MGALKKIPAAVLGGFVGGALAGLLEGMLIAWTGGGDEYGVFRFAVLSYGLIGAAMGAGIGAGTVVLPFLARDARLAGALAAGGVAALLGLAVARFRVVRDVYAENLPLASAEGLMV
ncbi:MAG: hypothetical protein ABR587_11980, partial [Candidatus Binatia bacterium]